MAIGYNFDTGKLDLKGSSLTNPLVFKGEINVSGDFPTSPSTGDFYIVTGSVTDSNTSQSFVSGDEIVWNGTNWTLFGNNLIVDTEMPKVTVGNGTDLIVADTTGTFWIAPWAGSIVSWAIWTGDGLSNTITTTVKKNGTTIGEDIDLTADDYATDTCSVSFVSGDKFSFNIDSNINAKKVVIQLLAEKA